MQGEMAGHSPKRAAAVIILMVLCATVSYAREVRDVALTIGPGWCVVTEERIVKLQAGRHEILLHNIPGEADLSSLTIRSRRLPIKLLSWSWIDSSVEHGGPAPEVALLPSGDASWMPQKGRDPAGQERRYLRSVRCLLESPLTGDRPVQVSYVVTGFRWSARYQLLVRGWDEEVDRPLSVDIDGTVQIVNETSLSFDQALVRLVGAGGTDEGNGNPPGFLMLDPESPLADLWRDQPEEHQTEYSYVLPEAIELQARAEQVFTLLQASRVRGSRRYLMTSQQIPLGGGGLLDPLPHHLIFVNRADTGLGKELPPGSVDIFPGSVRQYMMPGATIPHTPIGAAIRIEMGLSQDVFGGRHLVGRNRISESVQEVSYELVLRNSRKGAVDVEVDERPPTALSWDLISANAALTEKSGNLLFNVQVGGNSERRIRYKVRVERPQF